MRVKYTGIIADMRGQFQESIVFSDWRGRKYARRYTKPYNPKTCAQEAHRSLHRYLVNLFQTNIKNNSTYKEAWDIEATPYKFSGFNLFLSIGLGSTLKLSSPSSGRVRVEWKLGQKGALDKFRIVIYAPDGSVFKEITPDTREGFAEYSTGTGGEYKAELHYLAHGLSRGTGTLVKAKEEDRLNCTVSDIKCNVTV